MLKDENREEVIVQMAIYVDILLVTNYVVNMLLLNCYAKFAGRKLRRTRLIAAALVGALGSLSIFLPSFSMFFEITYKLALSATMILIVAKPRSLHGFCSDWLMFFAANFLFAGAMLAVWIFLKPRGMLYYNGIVYFNISAVALLFLTVTAYFIGDIFWRIAKNGRVSHQKYALFLRLGERTVTLNAILDTGNNLYEPFSGTPVAICRMDSLLPLFPYGFEDAICKLNFENTARFGIKVRFIPYTVVGDNGMLPAFRPDEAVLNNGQSFAVEDIYIAVSANGMVNDALLHPDLTTAAITVNKKQRIGGA